MNNRPISLNQLRQLIGARVRYLEDRWQVIEVLDDGPSLVLESLQRRVVQSTQYGQGSRRVPHRLKVPVLSHGERELHPEFLALTVEQDTP